MSTPIHRPHIYLTRVNSSQDYKLGVCIKLGPDTHINWGQTEIPREPDETTRLRIIKIEDGEDAAGWHCRVYDVLDVVSEEESKVKIVVADFRNGFPQDQELGKSMVHYDHADNESIDNMHLPHVYLSKPFEDSEEHLVSVYYKNDDLRFSYEYDALNAYGENLKVLKIPLSNVSGTVMNEYVNLPEDDRDDPPTIELDSGNASQVLEVLIADTSELPEVKKGKTKLFTSESDNKDLGFI